MTMKHFLGYVDAWQGPVQLEMLDLYGLSQVLTKVWREHAHTAVAYDIKIGGPGYLHHVPTNSPHSGRCSKHSHLLPRAVLTLAVHLRATSSVSV